MRIEGASIPWSSKASFGVFVGDGGKWIFSAPERAAREAKSRFRVSPAVSAIMVQSEGYVTAQAASGWRHGRVLRRGPGVERRVQLTSLDAAGTGVQVFNNSELLRYPAAPVRIRERHYPGSQAPFRSSTRGRARRSGLTAKRSDQQCPDVDGFRQGNISSANGSAVGIFETERALPQSRYDHNVTDRRGRRANGYCSRRGRCVHVAHRRNARRVRRNNSSIVESDTASALANVTLKTGASGTVILSGSRPSGNITADGGVAPMPIPMTMKPKPYAHSLGRQRL